MSAGPIHMEGPGYIVEVTANGSKRGQVRTFARSPDGTLGDLVLPLDDINIMSRSERIAYTSGLPDDARAEVTRLFDAAASKVLEGRHLTATTPSPADEPKDVQGQAIAFPPPEPWATPVDGAMLLDEMAALFGRYLILPPGGAETAALWVLFTYVHGQAWVRNSPILLITAPTKRCGKTRLIEILSVIVNKPLPTSNISSAALFRIVEKWSPTMLVDELDTFIHDNEELRGILNSGHTRRTASVIRVSGDALESRMFGTWAPKALAMIKNPPDTIRDRSVPIAMRRKAPGEQVARLRTDRLEAECAAIPRRAARWASDAAADLAEVDPRPAPGLVDDRQTDNWRPLLALADVVGGDWPERARHAAGATSGQHADDDSPGTLLLTDLSAYFATTGTDRITSADALLHLHGLDGRPWQEYGRHGKPITTSGLARLLKPYGIEPGSIRVDDKTPKGYYREEMADAFARYLPPTPGAAATAATSMCDNALAHSQAATPGNHVAAAKPSNSLPGKRVAGVAAPAPSRDIFDTAADP